MEKTLPSKTAHLLSITESIIAKRLLHMLKSRLYNLFFISHPDTIPIKNILADSSCQAASYIIVLSIIPHQNTAI